MGQYHLTVNIDKRQYLHPHKFGEGLKLREFSIKSNLGEALIVLLASSNGQGGGDLDTENLDKEEIDLIGSWAGDRIVVVGDYDERFRFVPEEFQGALCKNGTKFGYNEFAPGKLRPACLFQCAMEFFEDISDKIIKVIAKAESPYHPFACIDADDDGWRKIPEDGCLPDKQPKNPIAGIEFYQAYVNQYS